LFSNLILYFPPITYRCVEKAEKLQLGKPFLFGRSEQPLKKGYTPLPMTFLILSLLHRDVSVTEQLSQLSDNKGCCVKPTPWLIKIRLGVGIVKNYRSLSFEDLDEI